MVSERKCNVRVIGEYLNTVGYRDILHIASGDVINRQNCELSLREATLRQDVTNGQQPRVAGGGRRDSLHKEPRT